MKFSKNWNNKLDNKIFSTIRKHTKEKEEYYKSKVGQMDRMELNGELHHHAKLFDVSVKKYSELSFEFLVLDTGIPSRAIMDRVFSNFGIHEQDLVIVLLYES